MTFIKKCVYCGKEMETRTHNKKYCSAYCRKQYWKVYGASMGSGRAMTGECQFCGEVFFTNGIARMKYCCPEHFQLSRMKHEPISYLADRKIPVLYLESSEGKYEVKPNLENLENIPSDYDNAGIKRVFMMCGPTNFHGKFDSFSGKLPQTMQHNLMNGDTFVFCNRTRHQIAVLQWRDDGFLLLFKRIEHEQFPWIFSPAPKVIEITPEDLKLLIEYPIFMRRLGSLDGV